MICGYSQVLKSRCRSEEKKKKEIVSEKIKLQWGYQDLSICIQKMHVERTKSQTVFQLQASEVYHFSM